MFLPTQSDGNPYLQLISQLSAKQQQPVNIIDQNKPQQPAPERGMFGLRKPDPLAQQKMVDDILGAEMRAPVTHWGQALLRPLMGLVKTQKDAKATEFKEGRERADAETLINAVSGIRSGMDERGNVDLAGLLAGARNADMVNSIVGYADKRGDRKAADFRDDRRFNRSTFESDRNFAANQDDRIYNRGRLADADRRTEEEFRRKMDSYGDLRQGYDENGNHVFFQMPPDNSNQPRVLDDVRPGLSNEFNRKQTPAEAAKAREILAARSELLSVISDKGRDELQFDPTGQYADLLKTARQSLPGSSDPTYQTFLDALAGREASAPVPTANGPQGEVAKNDSSRLVPDPANPTQNFTIPGAQTQPLQPGTTPQNPVVTPVPDAQTQPSTDEYVKMWEQAKRISMESGRMPTMGMVPSNAQGKPDIAAMRPNFYYQIRGSDGRTKVIFKTNNNSIVVVEE